VSPTAGDIEDRVSGSGAGGGAVSPNNRQSARGSMLANDDWRKGGGWLCGGEMNGRGVGREWSCEHLTLTIEEAKKLREMHRPFALEREQPSSDSLRIMYTHGCA
jgi:hypothetical protein